MCVRTGQACRQQHPEEDKGAGGWSAEKKEAVEESEQIPSHLPEACFSFVGSTKLYLSMVGLWF